MSLHHCCQGRNFSITKSFWKIKSNDVEGAKLGKELIIDFTNNVSRTSYLNA